MATYGALSLNVKTSYTVVCIAVYVCIAAVVALAVIFGLRAKMHVKREKATSLPKGFSPLDMQRILYGYTLPYRITKALIVHWAQCGYITVKRVSKAVVRLSIKKKMPAHNNGAVFYDRGVYERERDVFNGVFGIKRSVDVNLNKPLITAKKAKSINEYYAVREDEGVFTSTHYNLKIITLILSFIPLVIVSVWTAICFKNPLYIMGVLFLAIGVFVARFVKGMPIVFKIIWCSGWIGISVFALVMTSVNGGLYDPYYLMYTSLVFVVIGSYFLIRFIDYRSKANLKDYSSVTNFKRFLLFAKKAEIDISKYYDFLPFMYVLHIKPFVKRKFMPVPVPLWYTDEYGKGRNNLL